MYTFIHVLYCMEHLYCIKIALFVFAFQLYLFVFACILTTDWSALAMVGSV